MGATGALDKNFMQPETLTENQDRQPAGLPNRGSSSMDFWELTSVWIQAVKGRYAGYTGGDLNQIFMRGPFAGWSEQELYDLAKRMDEAQTKFPIWPNK